MIQVLHSPIKTCKTRNPNTHHRRSFCRGEPLKLKHYRRIEEVRREQWQECLIRSRKKEAQFQSTTNGDNTGPFFVHFLPSSQFFLVVSEFTIPEGVQRLRIPRKSGYTGEADTVIQLRSFEICMSFIPNLDIPLSLLD